MGAGRCLQRECVDTGLELDDEGGWADLVTTWEGFQTWAAGRGPLSWGWESIISGRDCTVAVMMDTLGSPRRFPEPHCGSPWPLWHLPSGFCCSLGKQCTAQGAMSTWSVPPTMIFLGAVINRMGSKVTEFRSGSDTCKLCLLSDSSSAIPWGCWED